MKAWIAVHRKVLVFVAGTVLEVAVQVWGSSNVYVAMGILVATGLGIYQVPNAGSAAAVAAAPDLAPVPPPPPPSPVPPAA
jgi:hypothetical protein